MFGLVFALDGPTKPAQMDLLRAAGEDAGAVAAIAAEVQGLGKTARLPLIALAAPALKGLAAEERVEFLGLLQHLIEADRRITLEEFVVATMLQAQLGERAGRAVPARYAKLEPLAEDARLLLSLIAHATTGRCGCVLRCRRQGARHSARAAGCARLGLDAVNGGAGAPQPARPDAKTAAGKGDGAVRARRGRADHYRRRAAARDLLDPRFAAAALVRGDAVCGLMAAACLLLRGAPAGEAISMRFSEDMHQ